MADELRDQCVVLGALAFEGGQLAAGVDQQAFHLAQFEVGAAAHLGAAPHDAEGFLAGHEGLPGQHDAFVQLAGQQVNVGHLRDQPQLEGPAGFVTGQKLRQRGFVEAADAAPEIDFVGAEIGPGPVLPRHGGRPGHREIGRGAGARAAGDDIDAGPAAGLLDVVEGANLGDAGDGKLEVAVVAEGAVDQRQQVRVGE